MTQIGLDPTVAVAAQISKDGKTGKDRYLPLTPTAALNLQASRQLANQAKEIHTHPSCAIEKILSFSSAERKMTDRLLDHLRTAAVLNNVDLWIAILRITRPFTNILTRTQNFSFAKSSPLVTL